MPASVTVPRPIGHDGVIYTGTYAGFLGPRHDPIELQAPGEVNAPPAHNFALPEGSIRRGWRPASDCSS